MTILTTLASDAIVEDGELVVTAEGILAPTVRVSAERIDTSVLVTGRLIAGPITVSAEVIQ